MDLKFAEVLQEARKIISEGITDVKVDFIGEFVPEDASEGICGRYNAQIRFMEDDTVDINNTGVDWFEPSDGQGFDPQISTFEMDDFEFYPFEIISVEQL